MKDVMLTVTTPHPRGDGYDPGEPSISPEVASATKGGDLLTTLSSPGTQHQDTHVTTEVALSVDNVFTTHQPADQAVRVLQVPNPVLSSLVYNVVPETNTTHVALIGAVFLSLAWRRFRRR